jgi:hypothetical protein
MKLILKTPRGTFTCYRDVTSADDVIELKEMIKQVAKGASNDELNFFTLEDAYDEDGKVHSLLIVTRQMVRESVILITD